VLGKDQSIFGWLNAARENGVALESARGRQHNLRFMALPATPGAPV